MPRNITTHLMFEGQVDEALSLYTSALGGCVIEGVTRYGPGEQRPEGCIKRATFTFANQSYICFDSPVKHAFTFTPSISLFVECESEAELDELFRLLSEGGTVLMPVGDYEFSRRFGWLNDRFGVSWQLNLP